MSTIKPIFKVNDFLVSKNGHDRCRVIVVDETNQYYKVVNLDSILRLEHRLYFTHQHNWFVEEPYRERSYRERYKRIANSNWFNKHYNNKSLGEVISIEEI